MKLRRLNPWLGLIILVAPVAHAEWTPGTGTLVASAQDPSGHLIAIPDGADGAFVLSHTSNSFTSLSVHAHHVSADGAIAPGWPAGGALVCTSGNVTFGCYDQRVNELSACPDGAGGLFVAWGDAPYLNGSAAQGVTGRIVRLGADGAPAPGWPAGGLAVSDGAGQSALTAYADGARGASLS